MKRSLPLSLVPVMLLAQGVSPVRVSPSDLDRVKVGQPAPDFALPSPDGKIVDLRDYQGSNVVLVFYRGYW